MIIPLFVRPASFDWTERQSSEAEDQCVPHALQSYHFSTFLKEPALTLGGWERVSVWRRGVWVPLRTSVFTSNNHSGTKRGNSSGLIWLNVSVVKGSDRDNSLPPYRTTIERPGIFTHSLENASVVNNIHLFNKQSNFVLLLSSSGPMTTLWHGGKK